MTSALKNKYYGGESMVHYFALLLTFQVMSILIKNKNYDKNLFTTLGKTFAAAESEKNTVTNQLKQSGVFFYPVVGDIYTDYRTLRNRTFPGKEALPRWIKRLQFSLDDTYEKIYESCKLIVEQWWSE